MTVLELNSRLASVLASAESQLKEILFAAAREVQTAKGDVAALELSLENDVKVVVDGFKAAVTVGNASVAKVEDLIAAIRAAEKQLSDLAVTKVDTFVNEVKAEEVKIVDGVKNVLTDLDHI